MENTLPIVKKENFEKSFSDFKTRHLKQGIVMKEIISAMPHDQFEKTFVTGDKGRFYVKRDFVKETVSAEVNGLSFTFQIPMYRIEYWSSDYAQHQVYYEKE